MFIVYYLNLLTIKDHKVHIMSLHLKSVTVNMLLGVSVQEPG